MFSPNARPTSELALVSTSTTVSQNYFLGNGEWDLTDTSAYVSAASGVNNLAFWFTLKRKSKFVMTNVVLPIIFLAVLNILVFAIPADAGERIGFSVTMLLALAVFLTLVGDNVPKTSAPMPIFSSYLMAVLVLSLLICVAVIINLRFHHKGENSSPPKLCQDITGIVLCRICRRTKVADDKTMDMRKGDDVGPDSNTFGEEEKHLYSWQEFSVALDVISLVSFSVCFLVVSLYYLLTLKAGDGHSEHSIH